MSNDRKDRSYKKNDFDNQDTSDKTLFYDLESIQSQNSHTIDNNKETNRTKKARDKAVSKENKHFFRIVWIVMIVLISAMLTKYILVGVRDMLAIGKEEDTVTITLPSRPNIFQVTDTLSSNGVIEDPSFFRLYGLLTKSIKTFSGGTFEVKTNMDYEALINYLESQSNRIDIVKLTFPEGISINEYAATLEDNEVCSKDEFLKVCSSDEFKEKYSFINSIQNADKRYYKLEGYLFPDTYQFYKNEDPYNVVDKLLSNFNQKLNTKEKVNGYDNKVNIATRAKDKSTSIEDLITIASIIQAEAANKDDMYMVSSILHNRLSTIPNGGVSSYGEYGMNYLGQDSTVWYPYRNKESVPSNIVNSFESTYNTYKIEGLPPGPICNPGNDAIDAALNPESTNYYYFCHSKDGTAYYATNITDHNRNLAKAGLV